MPPPSDGKRPSKPGLDLVLAVLRGTALPPAPDWQQALALAESEGILPWFAHRAALYKPPIAGQLSLIQRQSQIDTFLLTSELTSLLKSFAAAGIPVLLLKGPSFAERVYGSAALRPSRDLDLLVRRGHFRKSQQLLGSLGFHPNYHPDDYHQSLSRHTTTVELHFDVENPLTFNFGIRSAWQQAVPTVFQGQPACLFAPADELLYLCLHGTRHRFDRLSYALDIAQALHSFPAANTRAPGLADLQILGTALARKLLPAQIPAALSHTPHLEQLADTLWNQLLTISAGAPDWQAVQRFYLELEPTPWHRLSRRLRQLRILATRITEGDRAFAARLGFPHPWAAHLFRPLRLISRKGGEPQGRRPK